jgi:hypothetical protein
MQHVKLTIGDEGLTGNVRYVCACGIYIGKDNANEHIQDFFKTHARCSVST